MKKLFLTSGLVLCMACPAFATDVSGSGNECVNDVLGVYSGSATIKAKWSANEYKITYKPGTAGSRTVTGNDVEKPVYYDGTTYKDGTALNTLASSTFSITGYDFNKWKSDKVISTGASSTSQTYNASTGLTQYKVAGNTVMTATWTPKCFGAVTLDANKYNATTNTQVDYEVTASPASIYVKYDNGPYTDSACGTAATLSTPTLTGYTFGGYYTAKNGGGTQMISTTPALTNSGKTITAGATWYAKWTAKSVTNGLVYTCGTAPTINGLTISLATNTPPASSNTTFDNSYTLASTITDKCALNSTGTARYDWGGWHCAINPETGAASSSKDYAASSGTVTATISKWKALSAVTCSAIWNPKTFTVQYAGGSAGSSTVSGSTASHTVTAGGSITPKSSGYTATGYTFAGWKGNYDNADGSASSSGVSYTAGTAISPYRIANTMTLTAQWTANKYNVKYVKCSTNATGSTGNANYTVSNAATYDSSYTPLAYNNSTLGLTAPDTGYHFVRWSGDYSSTGSQTATNYNAGTAFTYKIPNMLTLTGVCSANTTTVSYACGTKPSGASTTLTSTAPSAGTATYGSSFTFATPSSSQCKLPGYSGKWSCTGADGTSGLTATPSFGQTVNPWAYTGAHNGSVSCTATWTANKYNVVYTVGTGCTGGSTDTNGATFDASYTVKTRANASVSESTGYHFTKWSGNYTSTNGSGPADYTAGTAVTYKVQNDLTLTAVCPANETTVTYSCGSDSTGGTAPSNGTATYNSNFAFAANSGSCAKTGYIFDGWTCAVSSTTKQHKDFFGGSSTATLMTAGGTAAAWKYTGAHAGTVACTAHYTAKTGLKITYTCGTAQGSSSFTKNTPPSNTTGITYDGGYTLSAAPTSSQCVLPGYTFDGWSCNKVLTSGASHTINNTKQYSASATGTYKVDGDATCAAVWKANTISLTWNQNGATTNSSAGGATCTYDGGITIPTTAPLKNGWHFTGWTVQ